MVAVRKGRIFALTAGENERDVYDHRDFRQRSSDRNLVSTGWFFPIALLDAAVNASGTGSESVDRRVDG